MDQHLFLRATFDEMYSNKLSGSKVVDFFLGLNLPLAILLNSEEVNNDILTFVKPLLLRIVNYSKDLNEEKVSLTLLFNNVQGDVSTIVENYIQNLWDSVVGNVFLFKFLFLFHA